MFANRTLPCIHIPCFMIDPDHYVICIRYPTDTQPGGSGTCNINESHNSATIREMSEEIGICTLNKPQRIKFMYPMEYRNKTTHNIECQYTMIDVENCSPCLQINRKVSASHKDKKIGFFIHGELHTLMKFIDDHDILSHESDEDDIHGFDLINVQMLRDYSITNRENSDNSKVMFIKN